MTEQLIGSLLVLETGKTVSIVIEADEVETNGKYANEAPPHDRRRITPPNPSLMPCIGDSRLFIMRITW
jgi:hypothetical protein